mmetsp:Transcript_3321/g.5582  ORF Transcript_3321/g.5582 Transcript_3321/m.5582 type:complete len:490 (-) Transcript_3321:75-1544(-)
MKSPKNSKRGKKKSKSKSKSHKSSGKGLQGGGSAGFGTQTVWRAGVDPIEDGEELSYDPTAYQMLLSFSFEWPCLSFDIATDSLGEKREAFPHECYVVAGTQALDPNSNAVCMARLSNVGQGRHGDRKRKGKGKKKKSSEEHAADDDVEMEVVSDDDDDSDDSESEEEETPYFRAVEVHHRGGINRIRCLNQKTNPGAKVVATWGETGHVQIWDLSSHMKTLASEKVGVGTQKNKVKHVHQTPLHMVEHSTEGYALDWCRTSGSLLTGDCNGQILLTSPDETYVNWNTDMQSFQGHTGSVEDLQWSPVEETVFASCSVDKTIKIWDTRQKSKPGLSYVAHDTDVNVISWNTLTSCMIGSGGDDGSLRIWDMRYISNGQYVANFDYCKKAITSIEWSPFEGSMVATTSADNQICFWDLSVERDAAEEIEHLNLGEDQDQNVAIPVDIPPQLLFVHQGQENIKEMHWHEQIPGAVISTAQNGFNVFKPSNI